MTPVPPQAIGDLKPEIEDAESQRTMPSHDALTSAMRGAVCQKLASTLLNGLAEHLAAAGRATATRVWEWRTDHGRRRLIEVRADRRSGKQVGSGPTEYLWAGLRTDEPAEVSVPDGNRH